MKDKSLPIFSASISITNKCNMNCQFCYSLPETCDRKAQLSLTDFIRAIDELDELGIFSVQLSGGEPFLHPNIEKMCSYLTEKNISIYILSNGLIVPKNLEKFNNYSIKQFQISFDSLNKKSFESLRRTQDSYEKVLKNIKIFKSILNKELFLGFVLNNKNKNDALRVLEFAKETGFSFALIPLLTTGKTKKGDKLDMSLKEKVEIINNLFFESKKIGANFVPAVPTAFYPKEKIKARENYLFCSFPFHLEITAAGEVFPCDGLKNNKELCVGNIKENSLKEIWEKSPKLKEIRKIGWKQLEGVCSQCKFLKICRGGCRASSYLNFKKFSMPDPFCQTAFEEGFFPKSALKKSC